MSEQPGPLDEADDLLAVAHLLARVRLRRLAEDARTTDPKPSNDPDDAGDRVE